MKQSVLLVLFAFLTGCAGVPQKPAVTVFAKATLMTGGRFGAAPTRAALVITSGDMAGCIAEARGRRDGGRVSIKLSRLVCPGGTVEPAYGFVIDSDSLFGARGTVAGGYVELQPPHPLTLALSYGAGR